MPRTINISKKGCDSDDKLCHRRKQRKTMLIILAAIVAFFASPADELIEISIGAMVIPPAIFYQAWVLVIWFTVIPIVSFFATYFIGKWIIKRYIEKYN